MASERGRPRQFDVDDALEQALQVFWRQGFQGASISELTDAMGLTKPSLYAAYGDKEGLYLKALQRYIARRFGPIVERLETQADGRRAVAECLRELVQLFAQPGGCFVINGLADLGGPTTPPAVEQALQQTLAEAEAQLRTRLLRAQREGQLSKQRSAAEWAAYLMAMMAGLAMRSKAGVPAARLRGVIDIALAGWHDEA